MNHISLVNAMHSKHTGFGLSTTVTDMTAHSFSKVGSAM